MKAALRRRGVRTRFEDGQRVGEIRRAFRAAMHNGAVEPCGLVMAECEDEAAVQSAVRVAADEGVPIAVVAGGHDMCARGFVDGNLILNVRRMATVHTDRAAGEVTIGGGTLTRDVLAALSEDLVTVAGTLHSVGMTGLAIDGGYGTLDQPLRAGRRLHPARPRRAGGRHYCRRQ